MTLIPKIEAGVMDLFPRTRFQVPRSVWLHQGIRMKVYLRNTAKFIDGALYHGLVIASAEVRDADQGKGYFRELSQFAEAFATAHPFLQHVYRESVLDDGVAQMHRKHGYAFKTQDAALPTGDFFKWVKDRPVPIDAPEYRLLTQSS